MAYNGLHRLGWCICLGWVILACQKGAGGPVNAVLSWPAWTPLARISYSMYLIHYQVIAYFTALPSFSVSFSHVLVVYWLLALLCASIFVALVVVVLVEAPLVQLEKMLFKQLGIGNGKTRGKKIQPDGSHQLDAPKI
jgi:peptidoglycan/LPS O-acetylase OafA/YrhL